MKLSIKELKARLVELDEERKIILAEITIAESAEAALLNQNNSILLPKVNTQNESSLGLEERVDLFLKLFSCRRSVYPKRWENTKTGKSGYSPVCLNEWVKPICKKPEIKCGVCHFHKFEELNSKVIESHLRGLQVVGTYAIDEHDQCKFLACDFDESTWTEDLLSYAHSGRELGIEIAMERSRSGNGGHAWIFFEEPTPARIARTLGTIILSKCIEDRPRMKIDSFDRFFPSQDYLPKGGFGNLIALPLQKKSREVGNSCFIDNDLKPYSDQWAYLASLQKLPLPKLNQIVDEFTDSRKSVKDIDAFQDHSWENDQAIFEKQILIAKKEQFLKFTENVELIMGAMISIQIKNMPPRLIAQLKKTACFPNPEYYKLQRMRMPVYKQPRFIFSGHLDEEKLLLPRGCFDDVTEILNKMGANIIIKDQRLSRKRLKVKFKGVLTSQQKDAVSVLLKNDWGVLTAPPASGKTVIGCAMIADRKTPTLVLVHRRPLLDQWKERILTFLEIDPKDIGTIGGSKNSPTGKLDIGMIQTFTRKEDLSELVSRYCQIIIDEAHHIPAVSFEAILKELPERYILGMTATPYRKDGLEKILFQQCGPIRFKMDSPDNGKLDKQALIIETGVKFPEELGIRPPHHVLLNHIVTDSERNGKIILKVSTELNEARFPLVISDRTEHLRTLEKLLNENYKDVNSVCITGDLTQKQRTDALKKLLDFKSQKTKTVLFATASLIGEGFDLPELDTLFLTTPLSFEGRLVQYAGRLHRLAEGKVTVKIYDFLDSHSGMFLKMYRQRLKAYKQIGYHVAEPLLLSGQQRPKKLSNANEQQT
jgi:superfamily II DNA or RNA helicase